jgi:hypothetical protein
MSNLIEISGALLDKLNDSGWHEVARDDAYAYLDNDDYGHRVPAPLDALNYLIVSGKLHMCPSTQCRSGKWVEVRTYRVRVVEHEPPPADEP